MSVVDAQSILNRMLWRIDDNLNVLFGIILQPISDKFNGCFELMAAFEYIDGGELFIGLWK